MIKLYIDSYEKLKILKRKMPKVKWASNEDILCWYPYFPFVAYINEIQLMTYSGINCYDIEEKINIMAKTNKFFNLYKPLEIE